MPRWSRRSRQQPGHCDSTPAAPPGTLTPAVTAALAASARGLTSLRLEGCEGVADETVAALLAGGGPALRTLSLYWTPALRDAVFLLGTGAFTALTSLNLSGCVAVTDAGLAAVVEGCPRLTHLDVTRAKALTDAGLAAAVGRLTSLQSLTAYAGERERGEGKRKK